jgi:hypothetical protein
MAKGMMKGLLGGKKKKKSMCGKLSFKQRLIGWAICNVLGKLSSNVKYLISPLGWLITIGSYLSYLSGGKNIVIFAVSFSLGNLISILA